MPTKPEQFPPVYVIFTLLNALRRRIACKKIWREFRRQKIALKPRLSFWISVCRQAGLLSHEESLIVTRQARTWLNKSPEEQTIQLIEAWKNAPKNMGARRFRKKLLWKLRHDKSLTQKDLRATRGLEALGLYSDGRLTAWGRVFIKGNGDLPTPKPVEPCYVANDHFIAPLASYTDLLWEIEGYIRPVSPGAYPLTKKSLCGLQGDPQTLITLLERGLQKALSDEIKARMLNQPSLRLIEGIVLELSHPAELEALRRQPNIRRQIEQVLSPRHIMVSSGNAPALLKILKRRGVYLEMNEEKPDAPKKRTHFPRDPSQPSAKNSGPSVATLPKFTVFGEGRGVASKLELLEKYRQLQQAIDVLYRTPGYPAEKRRITPLLIEQRGEYTYISAYCQSRRAQLTFRLDRMEILGTA